MQYVQISVHYDEFTEIFPNSFEICRIAEFDCTISVIGAIVLKLNGKRCSGHIVESLLSNLGNDFFREDY